MDTLELVVIWLLMMARTPKMFLLLAQCCSTAVQLIRGPPLDSQGGQEYLSREIIYFNRARRRAENFTFCYMFISQGA